MAASIEFEFKGNLQQLRRDLGEASRLAKQSASEISRSADIGSLFRRTPERRAERAFGALGTGLLTGDIGTAIAGFTEKISAFGLAAGAGIGVAIGVFEKFRHEINETAKAFDGLQQNLARPLGIQSGLGPEALASEIEAGNKKLEEAQEKRETIWNKINEFLHRGTMGGQSDTRFGGGRAGPAGPALAEQHAKIIEEAEQRLSQLAGIRADKELKIANLKLQAAQGSEKEAALAKVALEVEEKRAALLLSRRGNALDLFKSSLAIDVEAQAARLQIEKKFPTAVPPTIDQSVDVSGHTLSEILKSGLEPYIDNGVQKWRWPSETPSQTPAATMDQPQATLEGIGTGIDGIKSGIDQLKEKMDKYWS